MQEKREGKDKESVRGKYIYNKKIGLKERSPRMPHTYITCKNQAQFFL
jgi:hypothetical protein